MLHIYKDRDIHTAQRVPETCANYYDKLQPSKKYLESGQSVTKLCGFCNKSDFNKPNILNARVFKKQLGVFGQRTMLVYRSCYEYKNNL